MASRQSSKVPVEYWQENEQSLFEPLPSYQSQQYMHTIHDQDGLSVSASAVGHISIGNLTSLIRPQSHSTPGCMLDPHQNLPIGNHGQHASDGHLSSKTPPYVVVGERKMPSVYSNNTISHVEDLRYSNKEVVGYQKIDDRGRKKPTTPSVANTVPLQKGEDEAIVAHAMSFAQAPAPASYITTSTLVKPVVIPQLTQSTFTNIMQPVGSSATSYARMYSPSLAQHGISETQFLSFFGGLNFVSTSSQKLQALNLTSGHLAFDPRGAGMAVSMVLSVGMQANQQKVFDSRAAAFLRRANYEFFHLRHLHVQECTTDELRQIAEIPSHAPLTTPVSTDSVRTSVVENRVQAIQPWVAPLQVGVLPAEIPQSMNTLQKINNFQAKHLNKQLERDTIIKRLRELSSKPQTLSLEEISRVAADLRASGDRILVWQADRFEKKLKKKVGGTKPGASENSKNERSADRESKGVGFKYGVTVNKYSEVCMFQHQFLSIQLFCTLLAANRRVPNIWNVPWPVKAPSSAGTPHA